MRIPRHRALVVATLGVVALLLPAAVAATSPPTATPQSVATPPGVDKSITLSASDPDGDALTFAIFSGPTSGSLGTIDPPNCNGQTPNVCTATVLYTPAPAFHGSASFTFTVDDGIDGPSAPATVSIAVNTTPTATTGSNSTNEEAAKVLTLAGADADGDALTFAIASGPSHGSLGSITGTSCSGSPSSCTASVTYTPTGNYAGPDSFTFTVDDGTISSTAATFSLTVNPINDEPSFTKGANQTVLEDSGLKTVANWATAMSPGGGADEAGQTLTFVISNNNNSLFSVQPAVSSTGTLTFTPALNANGAATVTIAIKDNGGTANGGVDTSTPADTFTVTVTAVNDPPTFTKGADQTVLEDSGAQSIPGWATNPSPGPADESSQTLTYSVTGNTNSAMFSVQPSVASNGTLTYTPAANANGTAAITVTLTDNGATANGGVNFVSHAFNINITAVNDPPIAANDVGKTVPKNSPGTVIDVLANDSTFPDTGETLTITAKTNGTHGTVTITDGGTTVTYVPAFAYLGSDSFTYTVTDSGTPALTDTATVLLDVVQAGTVTRLSGADRYKTSAAISAANFSPGVPVAYIATGLGFADALSGAPVAGIKGGPILLVPGTSIPSAISTELLRLMPAKIVILGGTGAVSASVAIALDAYTTGTVTRLSGATRYETSAAISAANFSPGVSVAYIATGLGFADALSGAPVAGIKDGPILLVPGTSIPSAISTELLRLLPDNIVILGGTGAVSASVAIALDAYTTGTVTRLSGADRYKTSAAISAANFSPSVPVVYIATGLGFADALSGAPVAGIKNGPILLVPGTSIPTAIKTELTRLHSPKIVILGGTGAVSASVATQLLAYTSGP